MSDVAVLLNTRAHGVTPEVVRSISHYVPSENVFISRSLDEAQRATHAILSRGFEKVVTGGGDGTLVSFINQGIEYVEQKGHAENLPLIGVLKLGTGNGISSYVGASSYLTDLLKMMRGVRERQRLSLVEVEDRYCHFAGFGLDANILNDYTEFKETWIGRKLKYAGSVPAVSLPKQLTIRRKYPVCHIINEGTPAYLIGDQGQPVGRPIEKGGTIYKGPILIAGVATMPYYGYRLKLYPHVGQRPGRMQLRVSHASTFETLSKLPWVWNGTYRSKTIQDYYCERVRIVFDKETPFQIAGDAAGLRREVEFSLSERVVELIDLTKSSGPLN